MREANTTAPRPPGAQSGGNSAPEATPEVGNLQLSLVILGLWLSLFLCSLDTTIISTALVHMSNDLDDMNQAGWIVVAYLLTFNSFILIWCRLSDAFGTKWLLLLGNVIFCVSSVACAVSKSMVQLISFRAIQGIGGSGMHSLVFVIMAQIVPMDKLGVCAGILSSVFALASLLGPVLGGVISDYSTWRWIFWMNAIVVAVLGWSMPNAKSIDEIRRSMRAVDVCGAVLCLAWSVPIIFALQEGGLSYRWDSDVILGTLVGGVAMFVSFGLWERWASRHTNIDTLFPVVLLRRPVVVLIFSTLFLLGFAFYAPPIQIPQRFQHVNGTTATRAGILVLPLTLVSPASALIAGVLAGKHVTWAPGLMALGACLNVAGMALMTTLPVDTPIAAAQFGYQALIGLSVGLMTPSILYLMKVEVDEKHIASAMGVGNMGRALGGCISLTMCGLLLRARLSSDLPAFLNAHQIAAVDASAQAAQALLTEEERVRVGRAYGEGFNLQFKGLTAFAGLTLVVVCFLCWSHIRSTKIRRAGGQSIVEDPPVPAPDTQTSGASRNGQSG